MEQIDKLKAMTGHTLRVLIVYQDADSGVRGRRREENRGNEHHMPIQKDFRTEYEHLEPHQLEPKWSEMVNTTGSAGSVSVSSGSVGSGDTTSFLQVYGRDAGANFMCHAASFPCAANTLKVEDFAELKEKSEVHVSQLVANVCPVLAA